ncbi:MAG: NAD(P)-binding domain-containing protein [Acidobacteriia bacterium]|nr:NAD(P)-binding domain-containing protein [Terriglobia bacterium]
MTGKTVGFIGGGRVAHIILGGLKKAGQMPAKVVVSDVSLDALNRLRARYPEIQTVHNDNRPPASQELVFAGLHPPALPGCLGEIKGCLKPNAILISLAPKLSIAKLAGALDGFDRIVRLIPNAPSIIGAGFNPLTFSRALSEAEKVEMSALVGALGKCPEVDEAKLEAYAIVTAMGPTYLWFQLHELQKIAESFGLSRREAETGISEMVAGTGKSLFGSGVAAEEVMDLVPVKPLGDEEEKIKAAYHAKLEALYAKLKN